MCLFLQTHTKKRHCNSEVPKATHEAKLREVKWLCPLKKPFKGLIPRQGSCWEEQKRTISSSHGVKTICKLQKIVSGQTCWNLAFDPLWKIWRHLGSWSSCPNKKSQSPQDGPRKGLKVAGKEERLENGPLTDWVAEAHLFPWLKISGISEWDD